MLYKDLIELSSALLTPTIAIIGTFIAIRQWKTNEAKRRHELFNDRYTHVYVEALNFYATIKNIVYQGAEEDDIQDLLEEYESKLYKYRFFIKESDFVNLQNILNLFLDELGSYLSIKNKKELNKEETEIKRKFELNYYEIEKQIYSIMEKYLRIEKEHKIIFKIKEFKSNFKEKILFGCYFYFPTFQNIFFKLRNRFRRKSILRFKTRIFKIFTKRIF